MDSIVIKGGRTLSGAIPIAGAKNACLTLMPATLLSDEPLTLTNAPRLSDIGPDLYRLRRGRPQPRSTGRPGQVGKACDIKALLIFANRVLPARLWIVRA